MQHPIASRVGAIFLPVSDIERARDWYSRLLGHATRGPIEHGHIYVVPLEEGSSRLVLDSRIHPRSAPGDTPLFHFDTPDVHAAQRWLREQGVEVSALMHEHWFTLRDPDGNLLMVCQCSNGGISGG